MVTPFWGLVVSSGRRIVRLVVVGGISTITGRRTPTASRPVTGEPILQQLQTIIKAKTKTKTKTKTKDKRQRQRQRQSCHRRTNTAILAYL